MSARNEDSWGVVRRRGIPLDMFGNPEGAYYTVPRNIAAFTPEARRVTNGIPYAEAEALCKILNAGGSNESNT